MYSGMSTTMRTFFKVALKVAWIFDDWRRRVLWNASDYLDVKEKAYILNGYKHSGKKEKSQFSYFCSEMCYIWKEKEKHLEITRTQREKTSTIELRWTLIVENCLYKLQLQVWVILLWGHYYLHMASVLCFCPCCMYDTADLSIV